MNEKEKDCTKACFIKQMVVFGSLVNNISEGSAKWTWFNYLFYTL